MMWTGTLSDLNTLIEDRDPVTGTGGDTTEQKTLDPAREQFVNLEKWMCHVLHQMVDGEMKDKHLQCNFSSLGLRYYLDKDSYFFFFWKKKKNL